MDDDIRRTLGYFRRNREIRVLGQYILSGIFEDTLDAINEILRIQNLTTTSGIYISLNEVTIPPNNKIVSSNNAVFPKSEDVKERSKFMIDLDPKDGTTEDAIKLSREIEKHLHEYSFSIPLIGMSGNGIHMIYDVIAPNDKTFNVIFKKALKYISLFFDNSLVSIDKNVYTSNRHAKIYGTKVRKNGLEKLSYIIQEPQDQVDIQSIIKLSSNITEAVFLAPEINPTNLSKRTNNFLNTGVPDGSRNQELFVAACDFNSKGYNMNTCINSLTPICLSIGLSESEILATIKSAYQKPRSSRMVHSNYKNLWLAFPYSNHSRSKEFDMRVITSNDPPWDVFYKQVVIKANPGWISENGISIDGGKILGVKYIGETQATSVQDWIKKIENGQRAYFLHTGS